MPEPRPLRPEPSGIVNPLPAAVVALAAVIFGIEVMFELAQRGLLGGGGGLWGPGHGARIEPTVPAGGCRVRGSARANGLSR